MPRLTSDSRALTLARRSPSARLYSAVPMLHVWPSISIAHDRGSPAASGWLHRARASLQAAGCSGRSRSARLRRRSSLTAGRMTWIVTVSRGRAALGRRHGHRHRDGTFLLRRRPRRVCRAVGFVKRARRRAPRDRSACRHRDRCAIRGNRGRLADFHRAGLAARDAPSAADSAGRRRRRRWRRRWRRRRRPARPGGSRRDRRYPSCRRRRWCTGSGYESRESIVGRHVQPAPAKNPLRALPCQAEIELTGDWMSDVEPAGRNEPSSARAAGPWW